MTIEMELWHLLVLIAAIVLAFWVLNRSALRHTKAVIAEKFKEVTDHLSTQDHDLKALNVKVQTIELDLARNYVTRKDHVNDVATLRAQFSALALTVERKLDDHIRSTLMLIKREMRK